MHRVAWKRIISCILSIMLFCSGMTATYSAEGTSASKSRRGLYSSEFAAAATAQISQYWEEDSYFSIITLTPGSSSMLVDGEEVQITPLEIDGSQIYIALEDVSDVLGFDAEIDRSTGNIAIRSKGKVKHLRRNARDKNASAKDVNANADGEAVPPDALAEDENPIPDGEILASVLPVEAGNANLDGKDTDTENDVSTEPAAVDDKDTGTDREAQTDAASSEDESVGSGRKRPAADSSTASADAASSGVTSGESALTQDITNFSDTTGPDDSQWYDLQELESALSINIEVTDNVIHITKPFQLCQLILQTRSGSGLRDNYGAIQYVSDGNGLFLLQYESSEAAEAAYEALSADGDTQYVEPNRVVVGTSFNSWGTSRIGAGSYKEYLRAGNKDTEVIVAVLDTGVDKNHTFLSTRMVNGWNFIDNNNNPYDTHSHGTHVAGTIVDCTPENVKIMPVKVLGDNGYSNGLSVSLGITWAADNGANVINMSLGGHGTSFLHETAVNYAFNLGVVSVAAAGNDSIDAANFTPANVANCITVSAANRNGTIAYFSNYGNPIDVAAPGVDIVSAIPGNRYSAKSGTSMAAPHVAAAVALLFTDNINLTPAEMKTAIRAATDKSGSGGWDPYFGTGILDLRTLIGVGGEPYDMQLSQSNIVAAIPHQQDKIIPLQAIISPDYAANKSVTYTTDNPNVAVYENGGVKIVGEGTAIITGTTVVGGLSDTCTVTVNKVSETFDNWYFHAATEYAGGNGTSSQPYLISTPEQLAKLTFDVHNNLNNRYNNRYFKLTNDIDLAGKEWLPIVYHETRSSSSPFTGRFDGNYYVIRNMTISDETMSTLRPGISYSYTGFIGYIFGGSLKNLGIADADISTTMQGGILAGLSASIISECFTTGKTTGSGLVGGVSSGWNNPMNIINCYSTAEAVMSGFVSSFSSSSTQFPVFSNCYASGAVGAGMNSAGFARYYNGDNNPIINSFYAGTAASGIGFVSIKNLNAGDIKKSYYLSTNPTGVLNDDSTTITDVTPKDMVFFTDPDTYTTNHNANWDPAYPWDFENVWDINPNINNGLPYLRGFHRNNEILTAATPTASPASGSVADGTAIALSCETPEAMIYYTLDGTDPTDASDVYYQPIIVTQDTVPLTIKAFAANPGWTDSAIATFNYTIDPDIVPAPTATPDSGEIPRKTLVALSTSEPDADIYYIINSMGDPVTSGKKYTAPIQITSNTTIRAIAVKSGMTDSSVSTFSYTPFTPATPISVAATGLDNLKVGRQVNGAFITYTLSDGVYADPITSGDFTVSGLPPGLSAGTAVRTSDTVITVPITGMPTTYSAVASLLTFTAIPANNVQDAVDAIIPIGTVFAGAVAKGDGAPVSGAPAEKNKTHNSIEATSVSNAGSTGQDVEYAISTTDKADPSALIWQSGAVFGNLASNTSYYVYARTAKSTNYNAGTTQVSNAITTSRVDGPNPRVYTLTVENGIDITDSAPYEMGDMVRIKADPAPSGFVFHYWTGGDGGVFGDASNAETTFTMPAQNATVTAIYKKQDSDPVPDPAPDPVPDPAPLPAGNSTTKSSRDVVFTPESSYWIEPPQARILEQSAQEKVLDYAHSSSTGTAGIRAESLRLLAGSGLRYRHDTVEGNAVQIRLSMNDPGNAPKDILVSGRLTGDTVNEVRASFEKRFANKFAVISMDQQGNFGIQVQIAAKVDLRGMDTGNLHFYSYNRQTNQYVLIQTPYKIDANGYLHFLTTLAGDIIVSDAPLPKDEGKEDSVQAQIDQNPGTGGNDGRPDSPVTENWHNPSMGGDYKAVGDSLPPAFERRNGVRRNDTAAISANQGALPDNALIAGIIVILIAAMILYAFLPRKSDMLVPVARKRRNQP